MARKNFLFTSESVSEGHPDKVSDQISDAILDEFLRNDIKLGIADKSAVNTRLGCETLVTTDKVVIAGEGRGQAPLFKVFDSHQHSGSKEARINRELISNIARGVIKDIGYDQVGFSYHGADIEVLLHGQSPDIAMGVDERQGEEGAGDQGMMFGFACTDSEAYEKNSLMPAPIYFSHKILQVLSEQRRSGKLGDLLPEAKSQVTVRYEDGKPVRLRAVLVSTQHAEGVDRDTVIRPDLIEQVIRPVIPAEFADDDYEVFVNPTGRFVIGGPVGDAGLTGRKIIVDTYGGYAPHGGGAFSGKDPTKVDRSAAYAARYLAKNVVAAGIAERCMIQVAYAIGRPEPMSLLVDTQGSSKLGGDIDAKLEQVLAELFPMRPTNIRRSLQLNKPIYRRTAAYGHFGRAPDADGGFSWEKIDLAAAIKKAVGG